MKVTRRKVSKALIPSLALVMVAAAGCSAGGAGGGGGGGGGGEGGTPKSGGTLTMAVNLEGQTMDPAWCGTFGFDRCAPVFGTLLRYDTEKDEFVPGMAESFESSDGKSWTLKLRPGMTFSDGTPFDAEAVVANWDRIKDPKTLSPAARKVEEITWKVEDATTVAVTSESANFQLPWSLTGPIGMIGSPTAIKASGKDFGNKPIGAGPFVLDKWTRNSQAEFVRNEKYYEEGLPHLDKFVLKVIAQDDQRLNALRAGEIDIDWSLLTKDAKAVEAEGFNVLRLPLVGGTGLIFNFEDPVAKDPLLREAMLKAFDSAQINNAVYPGDKPVDALLFPDSPYRDDSKGTFPKKDLPGAQKLFDDYLAKTGKTSVTLKFSTYAGIPALEQVAQILQSQMEKIKGLNFEIDAMDGGTLQGKVLSGKWQIAMGATLSQQADALYEVFHSEGTINTTRYSNPKVDAAFETTRTSNDEAEVTEAYKVLAGELSKDGPLRNWRYQVGHLFTPKKVKGLILAGTASGAGTYLERAWIDK
ncbi:ABC transporter substrate-binding protein [Aeromicrobium yanjiei]|uniref:ABC transporter substrate-binding protein n=1 Tax=Aeromicrobium yanjiei TaxID=2662028 RepID=A0A5Q2MAH5_9ACTN|nr:ABC transporter substrate-binding protein [Aeromicrobium yanjiei]QGG40097.1 ABC transporter substrate-binding protein [Aeromicrobium yanjiei]